MQTISIVSQSKQNFLTIRKFFNLQDCGVYWDGNPVHSITKETCKGYWDYIHSGHCKKTRTATLKHYCHPYHMGLFNEKKFDAHQRHDGKHYYTSATKHFALLMPEGDCHNGETDGDEAKELFRKLFCHCFPNDSERGWHEYLKLAHNGGWAVNSLAERMTSVVSDYFDLNGIQTEFEVKGTCTLPDQSSSYGIKSGALATVPYFETDEQYQRFDSLHTYTIHRVNLLLDKIEEYCKPHQELVAANRIKRLARKAEYKRQQAILKSTGIREAGETARKGTWVRKFYLLWNRVGEKKKQQLNELWDFDESKPLPRFEKLYPHLIDQQEAYEHERRYGSSKSCCSLPSGDGKDQEATTRTETAEPSTSPNVVAYKCLKGLTPLFEEFHQAWLSGGSDARKRDAKLISAILLATNGNCSFDDFLEIKESSGSYTNVFNLGKVINRCSGMFEFMHEKFEPSIGKGEPAKMPRWIEREITCSTKGRLDWELEVGKGHEFDEDGMPVKRTKTVTVTKLLKPYLRNIWTIMANRASNDGVPTKGFRELCETQGLPYSADQYRAVREWCHATGKIDIYDRYHRQGKCWRWREGSDWEQTPQKMKKRSEYKFPVNDVRERELLKVTILTSSSKEPENDIHDAKPPPDG